MMTHKNKLMLKNNNTLFMLTKKNRKTKFKKGVKNRVCLKGRFMWITLLFLDTAIHELQ